MKLPKLRATLASAVAACGLVLSASGPVRAELADISPVPLANNPTSPVLPNLMYILDDSGSMAWDHMPDNVRDIAGGPVMSNCKTANVAVAPALPVANVSAITCSPASPSKSGEPPYYAAQFNQIYYNPDITYSAGVTSTGLSLGDANPKAAINDAYINPVNAKTGLPTTPLVDLTANYPETYYCNTAKATAAQLADPTICKRNGIDNVGGSFNYFIYWSNNSTVGGAAAMGAYPLATTDPTTSFNQPTVSNTAAPYYFTITAQEYCSDTNLINCQLANADGSAPSGYTIPAPIRYCKTTAQASALVAVSDAANTAAPQCQKKFDQTNYQYPRYGRFVRTNIVPSTATYTKRATAVRTDCAAAASCTYAEELQNFANWYTYYRTRLQMMKSATGHAFIPIDDRYRVGFITINPNNPVSAFTSGGKSNASAKYLQINTFNAAQKSDWYTILYGQTTNGGTPLREALSRVGRHYAGQTDGINSGMNTDPIQYSCQQNFSLLTTDGYWNNNGETVGPVQIDGKTNVGNTDNVIDTVNTPPFVDRSTTGTLDALGASVTSSTPTTIVEQMVCTGNSKTTFGGNTGTQVTCGCGKGSTSGQVIERTMVQTSSVTTGEGIVGAPITGVTYTFKTINATCAPPLTTQTVTPGVYVDFATCKTASKKTSCTATFADTSTATANCAAGLQVILAKEIVSATQTVTQVAGSTTSSTVSGTGPNTYYFYNNGTGYYLNGAPNSSNVAVTSVACTASALTLPTPSAQFIATGSAVTTTTSSPIMPTLQSPNPATPVAGVTTFTSVAGGTPDTLADVAMYYYKTDLRPTGPVSQGNVPGTTKDFYNEQHMSTFTLGLGLQGNMTYSSTYETDPLSDFGKIKSAANGCVWSGAGTCDWPAPVMATPSTLDDLWHAAVNGRGVYYSASDPNTLADGLAGALAALKIQTAAASASATSSPNITQTDNFIYSSTFRTVKWDGEISARRLDPATGNVLPAIVWSADAQLNAQVGPSSDTRTIWTFAGSLPTKLKPFLFASLTATAVAPKVAEQSFFLNQCGALSQCPLLNATQKIAVNDGNNLVNYLRGQKGNEGTLFRLRDNVLGDSVNAVPAFVRNPNAGFLDVVTPNYQSFQSANASRQAVLYVAANDGMLHAFNGDTGSELWAFIPRFVFPQLAKLATDTWDVQHRYLVDGSPQTGDVFDTTASAWKSIIVGGLNSGGSGFYALDVTDPANPKGLWQFCNDSTICTTFDANMGLSYGNPVITKRKFDGKWVVLLTSGLNNAPPNAPSGDGTGWLWVLDAITGAVLDKVSTMAGSTTTPSGFAKISAFADSFNTDNTALWVYGGDLLGNLWRFDLSVSPPTAFLLATLKDGAGNPQSITTRPELGLINSNRVVFVGTGRYIGLNDLPDPSTEKPPLAWAYQQTLYAIKDNNTAYGDPRKKLIQQTLIDKSGTTRTTSTNKVDFTVDNGWYVDFNPGNTTPGERVNIDPQLVLGTLVVQTNIPNNNACTVGGDSFLYQFDYASGQYVSTATGQIVAQKTYGQIAVGNAIVRTTTGVIKAEQSFSGGQPPVSTGIYIGSSKGLGRRVSWRELLQ